MSAGNEKDSNQASNHSIKINNRQDLIFVLSEASTLEHMIMCEYLFAAFSLKKSELEGLSSAQLGAVRNWEGVITTVAIQEMTHLSLVNNMLISIGSGPYFDHPSFPQPSKYFSPNIKLALIPFGEQALRHFLYLERPEGMSIEGVPGFEILGNLNPPELGGRIVPQDQYFSTVGNLYRDIERGFQDLAEKYGENGLFIGTEYAQATEERFGLPSLFAVNDLSTATKAVEGIVEMGEGARGDWQHAHFGMFLGIFKEFMDMKKRDPSFHATKPVVASYVKPPVGVETVPLITDPYSSKVADLFNATYGLAIEILSRYYVHEKEFPNELQLLADTAVGMMIHAIKPIGIALTTLPVGGPLPGLTCGPSFELLRKEHVLPRRVQSLIIIKERIAELASHCSSLSKEAVSPSLAQELGSVQGHLLDFAKAFD